MNRAVCLQTVPFMPIKGGTAIPLKGGWEELRERKLNTAARLPKHSHRQMAG